MKKWVFLDRDDRGRKVYGNVYCEYIVVEADGGSFFMILDEDDNVMGRKDTLESACEFAERMNND